MFLSDVRDYDMNINKCILIFTCFNYPHTGGLSRGITNEVNYFSKEGYSVKIISPTSDKSLVSSNNHIYIYVPKWLKGFFYRFCFSLKAILALKKLEKESEIYFVDCHDVFSYFSIFVLKMGHKALLTLHSVQSKDIFTMSSMGKRNLFHKSIYMVEFMLNFIFEIIILNLANKILCVSEYEYNDTISKKIFAKSSKVFIVRNGTSDEFYNINVNSKESIKKELGIAKDEYIVMFLGRMVPKNSPMLILQAVNYLKNKPLNVKYIFVGDGEEKNKLEKFVIDHELNDKVIFTGVIPSEQILYLADIFVSHCSSLVDGPGRTIFEAMHFGIPVITGNDYIKRSIFLESEIFLVDKDDFVEIGNAIYKLLEDDEFRFNMGNNAKEKAFKEFTLEAQMNKIENIVSM